jgi:dinuclear metal center YbgI/SA1388 family protein
MHFKHRSAFFFDMTCNEIIEYIEGWAPKEIAWQKDNVGLQVGNRDKKIKNIMLCLEVTMDVVDDAIRKKCNLIFSHHPLLFRPLKKLDLNFDKNSIMIEKLIKNDITLFSAHTNLDFTQDGVSFELAKLLKLKNIKFLKTFSSNQYKLSVFVPANILEKVSSAIFANGGGVIGEYSHCSFRTKGEGTFIGSEKTKPAVGKKGNEEKVEEIKLEVLIDSWNLNKVITAMLKVHPYEEPAFDIYPLQNENNKTGAGAIGELKNPLGKNEFLKLISSSLKIKNFRYTNGKSTKINKVAVCGGSCSELINTAISVGADAFITADIKYHTFHDAKDEILLVDAGHYETEIPIMNEVQKRLKDLVGTKNQIKVFKYSGTTNPVIFYQ